VLKSATATLSNLASHLVPALGLFAASMTLVLDVEDASNLGGAQEVAAVLAIVGDALEIAGCIAQLTIVGAPVGWVLKSVATAVTYLAKLLSNWLSNQQMLDDEKTCLLGMGLDTGLVTALVGAPPAQLSVLGKDLGYSADALQWMAVTSPNMLLDDAGHGNAVDGLAALNDAGQFTSDQKLAFLQAAVANIGQDELPSAVEALAAILHGAMLTSRPQTISDWQSYLSNFSSADGASQDPGMIQLATDAAAWLSAQATP
jgi:hypothetical protein